VCHETITHICLDRTLLERNGNISVILKEDATLKRIPGEVQGLKRALER